MKRSHSKTKDSHINKVHKTSESGIKLFDVQQHVISQFVAGTPHNSSSTGFLTAEEKSILSLSTKSMFHGTKHSRDALILKKFLLCVAHGEQDKAERLLKIKHGLPSKWLLTADEFTDYSGRTFHCTAYEYAYWSKDTHMCRMLEEYMDEGTKASVLKRIEKMERIDKATGKAIGLTYQQHGETHHSAHFDFTPLKEALQACADRYVLGISAHQRAARLAAWAIVGKAQRDVPAHVAQEYCRLDRSFSPCPKFNEPALPRVLTFYNYTIYEDDSWFCLGVPNSGLNFSVFRGNSTSSFSAPWIGWCENMLPDLMAITRLDEVRTIELTQSHENLTPPATSQCRK